MIRVIGIGSPFGDDRVGWHVVELLRGRVPDTVDLVALDRPGAALADWLADTDRLLLVDAVQAPLPPGRIVCIDPADPPRGVALVSSHGLDLAQTLALAEVLGHHPASIELYGIVLGSIDGESLSETVADAARRLADRLARRLAPASGTSAPVVGGTPDAS